MKTPSILTVSCIVLSCLLVPAAAQAGYITNAPNYLGLERGLVGFWSFDGKDIAGIHAYDKSGQGNRGVLTSGPVRAAGKLGQALQFDGSNDYLDAVSPASLDNIAVKTISAWIKMDTFGSTGFQGIASKEGGADALTDGWVFYIEGGANNRLAYDHANTGNQNGSWATPANSLTTNRWYHIVMVYDRTSTANDAVFYIDGTKPTVTELGTPNGGPENDSANGLVVGAYGDGIAGAPAITDFFDGLIDDVRIYNRALSADEIKRLYKIGGTAKINTTISGPTNGLVGYWSFDGKDMAGTRAFDRSGSGKNGTLTGSNGVPVRTAGKISQGVHFDGVDDYISVGNAGSSVRTISFWMKANVSAGSSQQFTNTYSEAGTFSWNASTTASTIQVEAWGGGGGGGGNTRNQDGGGGGGGGAYAKLNSFSIVQNDDYTVVVGAPGTGGTGNVSGTDGATTTFNGTSLQADGGQGGQWVVNTVGGGIFGLAGNTTNSVGDAEFNGGNGGQGRDNGSGTGGGGGEGGCSSQDGDAGNAGGASPGPGGTGCDGGDGGAGGAADGNGSPGSSPGGGGGGAGSDETAGDRIGGNGAAGRVVITWTETSGGSNLKVINIDGTDQIEISSGAIAATSFPNATVYVDGNVATAVDSRWHHVVVVDTTGVNASSFEIGRVSSSYFNGLIDDVRLYDRALSADEIKRLYNTGGTFKANTTLDGPQSGLVGWWTFDGKAMAGNRAFDMSGQGNYGTLTGTNGLPVRTAGKIGQALQFDGVDDYVEITDNAIFNFTVAQNYTWSFWLKPNDFEEWNNVWSQDVNDAASGFFIYAHTSTNSDWGPVTVGISAGLVTPGGTNLLILHSTNNALSANAWHHVVVTYNGSLAHTNRLTIYVNGIEVTDRSDVRNTATVDDMSPALVRIGQSSFAGENEDGTIDDVRIYNRVLTKDEIKRLYNLGR